jgi:hypothetical protein
MRCCSQNAGESATTRTGTHADAILLSLNCLSLKIKAVIMDGYMPGHLSVQEIVDYRRSAAWEIQKIWLRQKNSSQILINFKFYFFV